MKLYYPPPMGNPQLDTWLQRLVDELEQLSDRLSNLTDAEVTQYENMGTTTISAAQWALLGTLAATLTAAEVNYCDGVTSAIQTQLNTLENTTIHGDGTAGRVRRGIRLIIDDGTDASTLKCTVESSWNGDTIATTDNIVKDDTTGNFTLDSNGKILTIEAAGLSGNVKHVQAFLDANDSGTPLFPSGLATSNDIAIRLRANAGGVPQDMTVLVDTGPVYLEITYITDA